MTLRKIFLFSLTLTLVFGLTGCSSGDTPSAVESETAETEIAAELPAKPPQVRETVIELQPSGVTGPQASLFSPGGDTPSIEGDGPIEIEFAGGVEPEVDLSAPEAEIDPETDIEAIRFALPGINFELPLGWEAVTLGQGAHILRPIGAETIFEGPANTSAYIYVRMIEPANEVSPLRSELKRMRSGLGGVEVEELPISPILDGVRVGGQFVEGSNDQRHYRAFLTVIPLTKNQVVELVFWGDDAAWVTLGSHMARVLETVRLPAG
jgi:hypothetical protein